MGQNSIKLQYILKAVPMTKAINREQRGAACKFQARFFFG
jgi:hypothetical protein